MDNPRPDLDALVALVARLRAPDGCPWDQEQTLADVRAYLLEEAHEAAEAVDRAVESGDYAALGEELGDVLFQVAFIVRLAGEAEAFGPDEVVQGVIDKMVARHPHVFGDESLADAAAVRRAWEARKLRQRSADDADASLLDGVPVAMPALVGAYRLTQKAAGVGFDWPDAEGAIAKVREELAEVEAARAEADVPADAVTATRRRAAVQEEIGDLLFSVANVARKLSIDPEAALAATNRKFRRRFAAMESGLAGRGHDLGEVDLAAMDAEWEAVKRRERAVSPADPPAAGPRGPRES